MSTLEQIFSVSSHKTEPVSRLEDDVRKLELDNVNLLTDNAIQAKTGRNLAIQVSVLEDGNRALQDEIASLEKKCETLEHDLKDSKSYTDLVEKMLDRANDASSPSSERLNLEEMVENLREDNKRLETIIESMGREWQDGQKKFTEENEAIMIENRKLQNKIDEMRAETENKKEELEKVKSSRDRLADTVNALLEKVEDLRSQISQNTEEYLFQREQLEKANAKIKDHESDTDRQLKILNRMFQEDREEMRSVIKSLEWQRQGSKKILKEKQQELKDVNQSLASTEKTNIKLQNQVAHLEAQLKEKEANCRTHLIAHAVLELRLDNAKSSYGAEREMLFAERNAIREKFDREVDRLQNVLRSKIEEAAVLQSKHSEREKELEESIESIRQERDMILSEKSSLDAQLQRTNNELSKSQQDYEEEELSARLSKARLLCKLNLMFEQHLENMNLLETKIRNMKYEHEEMETRYQKVREDLGVEELDDKEDSEGEVDDVDHSGDDWEIVEEN